ncbi:hypothetical protein [Photorhabdus sp. SF281]|uniref:hypothetical protein n=1 Tax=Photorhabdus sp. SF281 TaxID=3459527 RepID=UPI00404466CB
MQLKNAGENGQTVRTFSDILKNKKPEIVTNMPAEYLGFISSQPKIPATYTVLAIHTEQYITR